MPAELVYRGSIPAPAQTYTSPSSGDLKELFAFLKEVETAHLANVLASSFDL
jgi:hypothetical protein